MKSFERFLAFLAAIPDPRRAEGKRYEQRYVLLYSILAVVAGTSCSAPSPTRVLLYSILAVVAGANSYRGIRTFIEVHRRRLNKAFGIGWKRPPAHTSIRTILSELDAASVEKTFREHAANLNGGGTRTLALDGKALRGSFDKGIVIRIPLDWALPVSTQSQFNIDLRPITRDGGQRLVGDATLYDETQRFSIDDLTDRWNEVTSPQ